jgi:hypothetical protein
MRSLEECFETTHDRKMLESLSISGDFLHLSNEDTPATRVTREVDTPLPPSNSSYSAFLSSEAEKERQEGMVPAAQTVSASALRPPFPIQNGSAEPDFFSKEENFSIRVLGFCGADSFLAYFHNLDGALELVQIWILDSKYDLLDKASTCYRLQDVSDFFWGWGRFVCPCTTRGIYCKKMVA